MPIPSFWGYWSLRAYEISLKIVIRFFVWRISDLYETFQNISNNAGPRSSYRVIESWDIKVVTYSILNQFKIIHFNSQTIIYFNLQTNIRSIWTIANLIGCGDCKYPYFPIFTTYSRGHREINLPVRVCDYKYMTRNNTSPYCSF